MAARTLQLVALEVAPLAVPLRHPFVIATGRVDVTPNALVRLQVRDSQTGQVAVGLGEAATLPPVTLETLDDVLRALQLLARTLPMTLPACRDVDDALAAWFAAARLPWLGPCARAGLDMALHDAWGQLDGRPVFARLHAGAVPCELPTDVTLAIASPAAMAEQAVQWRARAFGCFKVKVGQDVAGDMQRLQAIVAAAPGCTLRVDANGGYSQADALALLAAMARLPARVECFEQPCAADDLDGLRACRRFGLCAIVADESCQDSADVQRLADVGAVDGVNLKLVKTGGIGHALHVGQLARKLGLQLMVGSMVETRLGVTAAAHLCTALGGVEFADLDTAFLLTADPFTGGYAAAGAILRLSEAAGLGVAEAHVPEA